MLRPVFLESDGDPHAPLGLAMVKRPSHRGAQVVQLQIEAAEQLMRCAAPQLGRRVFGKLKKVVGVPAGGSIGVRSLRESLAGESTDRLEHVEPARAVPVDRHCQQVLGRQRFQRGQPGAGHRLRRFDRRAPGKTAKSANAACSGSVSSR